MRVCLRIAFAGLAGLAACGGSSGGGGGFSTPGVNAFTGSITVATPLPGGTTSCGGASHTVTFTAGGVSPKQVTVQGGECVTFSNGDTGDHQPATQLVDSCHALDGPVLHAGQSFTSQPLGAASGMQTCSWMDALNPPGGGH